VTEPPSVERYVAGHLTEEETARFETAMIERPDLAADVNVRRRIKAGLALLEERRELEGLLKTAPSQAHYLRYAAAAAVLVAAAGLWSLMPRNSAPLQALIDSRTAGSSHVAASFMLTRTRSGGTPSFTVQRNGGLVRLQIVVDDPDAGPYSVRLVADAEQAAAGMQLKVSQTTDGFAEVYLDPRELDTGSYTLTVTPSSGTEQVFPFTLNLPPK